ncbi:MAG: PEGA domain-containing protein [Parahaliea sp.]
MTSPRPSHQQPGEAIQPIRFEPLSPEAAPPVQQRHPLRWLLLAIGAVFLLFMAFLLTSRSVLIELQPQVEASISISGLHLPFGKRILIRPGNYAVQASAEGFHPLADELSVSEADSQTLTLKLIPLPGLLSFNSKPAGARVLLDNIDIGQTPLTAVSVEAGEHDVQIQSPRYLSWAQKLFVEGRNQNQQIDIELAPAWADIHLASEPAGATISLNGEAISTTPATVAVLQGEQQVLALELPGFARWQQSLAVVAGEAQNLPTVILEPAAGVLTLNSQPAGANVTLNGEFQGQTPLVLELSPDTAQRIHLSRPGYQRHSEQITLGAGQNKEQTIALQAILGEIQLQVSPAQAVVTVNGRTIGKGSQTLKLPAVEQTIEVSLDGYAPLRERITPRSGLAQRLNFQLQTREEARMAKLSPEVTTAVGQTLKLFIPGNSPLAEFSMGASRREPGRRANEVLRPVALQRMFYLQTTEVTNAQFRQFLASHNSGQTQGNSLNREHQPVVSVSWQQAAQFCNWLSQKEGLEAFYLQREGVVTGFNAKALGYRLPTEAEWAWAARTEGSTLLRFPWGDAFPPTKPVENYADNSSAYVTGRILNGYTDGFVVSAPVASFKPNTKGLYDMGGNVAEWVNDVYSIPVANGPRASDPLGAQNGDNYVLRGASWSLSKLSDLRLSYRDYGQAGRDDVGFRIARYAQ